MSKENVTASAPVHQLVGQTVHRIAHLFGWNTGTVESWTEDGIPMVGFRCAGCRKIFDAHEIRLPNAKDDPAGVPPSP